MIAEAYQVPEKPKETERPAVPESVQETAQPVKPVSVQETTQQAEPDPLPETAPAPAVTAPLQTEATAQTVSRRPWEAETTVTTAETATVAAKQEESYTAKDFLNDALDLVGSVLLSVYLVMLVFTYLFRVADVDGDSMIPTLQDKNKLLLTRVGRSYETGDILILNSRKAYTLGENGELKENAGLGKQIVKRLIAQGGQEVNIDFTAGVVYVDGQALDEPYVNTPTNRDNGGFTYPFTVPEGYVFVMGDNRYISLDSRSGKVGLLPVNDITGRVIWRILPLSEFGGVD